NYDPDKILDVVSDALAGMVESGLAPNLAFVPLDLQSEWMLRFKIRVEDRKTYLVLPNIKLRLINSWNKFPFQDIVIIDKTKCKWIYHEFAGSRIKCSIPPPTDPESTTVKINVETRGTF